MDTYLELIIFSKAGNLITVTDGEKAVFENRLQKPYLTALIRNLHVTFPAVDIITAFSIFNSALLPENQSDWKQYGTSELQLLLSHYSSGPLAVDTATATS